MKCPYCSKEMETGAIQAANEISWYRGTERHAFRRANFYEGSVLLSKISVVRGSAVLATLCRDCQKIVIDYADNACDLNAR